MRRDAHDDADVIVVGGGPAGAATAAWCARWGLEVVVLDRARFPRDKVCGDGLTPRAVAELHRLDVQTADWQRIEGLRLVTARHRVEVPWPLVSTSANHGLVRPRSMLDAAILDAARRDGAQVHEGWSARSLERHNGRRITGVVAERTDARGRRTGTERTWRAPVIVEATGVAARVGIAAGRERADNRPLGVAVRTYVPTPRAQEPWMESHLELWDGEPGRSRRMPGYGWVFPTGDGMVNLGLGSVSSSPARQSASQINHRQVLERWQRGLGEAWELGEQNGPMRAAALPMALDRGPLYADGLMLVGDAAGMVSPFNGEGIAYAMLAGRTAAHAVARARRFVRDDARERALAAYPASVHDALGGYFTLGRAFVRLIEHPEVLRRCTRYGLGRSTLLSAVVRLLADAYEPHGGDLVDRTIALLARAVPRS